MHIEITSKIQVLKKVLDADNCQQITTELHTVLVVPQ